LLITCPDRPGIIAAVTRFLHEHGGNILELDQHTDPQEGVFFMRVEIDLSGFGLREGTFGEAFESVARSFSMDWRVYWGNRVKRMAILVSRAGHCLSDLLWRWRDGELRVEIPFVASNHDLLRHQAESAGIPFHHLPVTPETKPQQEGRLLELIEQHEVDFLVLARYMQILRADFVRRFPARIINIHHSFLPAFSGARPYHQAYERGVKIIGATSHYVTERLDDGPIIAQATTPIDHRDTVQDLVRKGRDLERVVLATAVRQHVEDKILVCRNRTVVFD
ncbi:MAG: formyltetrahydrofolate deformylase, partial [Planctomycetota bacterium]